MKTEISYIPGSLYEEFDLNGRPKSKLVKQREHIEEYRYKKDHDGQEKPAFEPSEQQINCFNNWLEDFQEDLVKIIGKYRFSNHLLTAEELTSEINLSLLKKRADLIEYISNKGFNQINFKHSAFIYARNLVKWSHMSISNKSYHKRREDIYVSDGEEWKTSFELAVESQGKEDEEIEGFDCSKKQEYLLKIIKEYSNVLTNKEKEVFSYLEKGKTHIEIAEKLGVTHQMVSIIYIQIKNKIKNHFGQMSLEDNSYDKISKGKQAVEQFFTKSNDYITDEDREKLKKILHLNPYQFTSKAIAEIFFKNKYTYRQIVSSAVRQGISNFLRKERPASHKFDRRTEDLILEMFLKGHSCEEVSRRTNVPIGAIRSKRGHFVQKNILTRISREK
tara:strand:- start:1696 stop:2865 length:1170 start_codon:yes stop_codon:yes gene_type:complete